MIWTHLYQFNLKWLGSTQRCESMFVFWFKTVCFELSKDDENVTNVDSSEIFLLVGGSLSRRLNFWVSLTEPYLKSKSPRHTGPHGEVFALVCYFPKGFDTFCISSWILWLQPKCQSTHGTPWNCFLTAQALRCMFQFQNNIFNPEECHPWCFAHWHTSTSKHSGNSLSHNSQNLCHTLLK